MPEPEVHEDDEDQWIAELRTQRDAALELSTQVRWLFEVLCSKLVGSVVRFLLKVLHFAAPAVCWWCFRCSGRL
jgi:hypothetical protein